MAAAAPSASGAVRSRGIGTHPETHEFGMDCRSPRHRAGKWFQNQKAGALAQHQPGAVARRTGGRHRG